MPLNNPVPNASISQDFGYTGLHSNGGFHWHYNGQYYTFGFHTGIDLSAPDGSLIYNVEYGVVHVAAWDGCGAGSCWGQGGGYVVIVRHNTYPFFSSHAHMNAIFVTAGQPVYKGQPLGRLDTQGYATGPHDHHSVWLRGLWPTVNDAYPMNPRWYWPGGQRANYREAQPAKVRISANEPLRRSPGLSAPVRYVGPNGAQVPYFYTVHGQSITAHGVTSDLWRLVWYGNRFVYAWAPRTSQLRTLSRDDEDRAAVARALGVPDPDGEPIGGTELAERAPGLHDNNVRQLLIDPPPMERPPRKRAAWWQEHERLEEG